MKISPALLEKIVKEELDKFIKENKPDFRKMMKRDAAHASANDPRYSQDFSLKNKKDKENRLAQKNVSGSREIELDEEDEQEEVEQSDVFVVLDGENDVVGVFSSLENIEQKFGEEHGLEILQFELDGELVGFMENKFPKTTPPKTSEKSSKMISQAVKRSKDKKGEQKK